MPSIRLGAGEPEVTGWQIVTLDELVHQLGLCQFIGRLATGDAPRRPAVLAIDGRSSAGKSTLSARIAATIHRSSVVHTDDIAWFQARFDWTDLLIAGVLEPLRARRAVDFRPPAWDARGRDGSIVVPAGQDLVIIEGVGCSRQSLRQWYDAAVWVQADLDDIERRNAERVRAGETTTDGVAGWMAEEFPFLEGEQPWTQSDRFVRGLDDGDPRHGDQVAVAAAIKQR